MKKSGYRTILHIYLIFFLSLVGAVLAAVSLCMLLITIQKPDGTAARSDWPKTFTEEFKDQIIFMDGIPHVKQAGLTLLRDQQIGLQIIDEAGNEIYSFQRPEKASTYYSMADLLRMNQADNWDTAGGTSFAGIAEDYTLTGTPIMHALPADALRAKRYTLTGTPIMHTLRADALRAKRYIYIVHFPLEIRKINMHVNGERFSGGKTVILSTLGVLILVILAAGMVYGFWTANMISRLAASIKDISKSSYLPRENQGAFGDLYDSLNTLDMKIKTSDRLREETESMRREWITNITHDLKTPLSPIKGYSEILLDDTPKTEEQCRRYAETMLKNAACIENLIDDLKLTYQLESGMVPIVLQEQNLVRFLRELTIDILNRPEYENRRIQFESREETIMISFDHKLLTRAFQNLIMNGFVHGDKNTEITLRITALENEVNIAVTDNGKGMDEEQAKRVFERYYRGTNTGHTPEGTGLGLAIAKNITELHGGTITVSSILGKETAFLIRLPLIKVN